MNLTITLDLAELSDAQKEALAVLLKTANPLTDYQSSGEHTESYTEQMKDLVIDVYSKGVQLHGALFLEQMWDLTFPAQTWSTLRASFRREFCKRFDLVVQSQEGCKRPILARVGEFKWFETTYKVVKEGIKD